MTLSVKELGIRVVLISCTGLLSIQTIQLCPFLHNHGEIVWTCCDWEIQVSTSGFELEFSPPQLNALPLSYDAPIMYPVNCEYRTFYLDHASCRNFPLNLWADPPENPGTVPGRKWSQTFLLLFNVEFLIIFFYNLKWYNNNNN